MVSRDWSRTLKSHLGTGKLRGISLYVEKVVSKFEAFRLSPLLMFTFFFILCKSLPSPSANDQRSLKSNASYKLYKVYGRWGPFQISQWNFKAQLYIYGEVYCLNDDLTIIMWNFAFLVFFFKNKSRMLGDCCVFKFLRLGVDGNIWCIFRVKCMFIVVMHLATPS